ncbi:MAG: hypothetical protein KGI78_00805 [Patescibacteria group bacterium]|nr:hypothetical protein [Patescibacteria group bacterium]
MPLADPKKRREYQTRYMREVWYPKNKEKHLGYVKRNKMKIAAFIDQYKRERKCVDCGFAGKKFPYVLDFDHINGGASKKFDLGSWAHFALSIDAVQREMSKCELVCANCHRIRTFSRKKL